MSTLLILLQNTRIQARHRSVLSLTLAGGGGGGVGRGGLVGLRGDPGTVPVQRQNIYCQTAIITFHDCFCTIQM